MNTPSKTTKGQAQPETRIEITDLGAIPSTKYIATSESDCKDSTDRSAYREAVRLNDVITMGKVIACPLPSKSQEKLFDALNFSAPVEDTPWRETRTPQHSPLPWNISDRGETTPHTSNISDGHGSKVATVESYPYRSTGRADAKLIVASVNHADKLAEALKDVLASKQAGDSRIAPSTFYIIQNALNEYEAKGDDQ